MNTKSFKLQRSELQANSPRYELIENETLTNCKYNGLVLSGSLLKNCDFEHAVFENCTFFGCKLQGINFKGCQFTSCKFLFTQIQENQFMACTFEDNFFDSSPADQCSLTYCQLDTKCLNQFSQNESNTFGQCFGQNLNLQVQEDK